MKRRVLIVCTGNIARSQIAEGLWRHFGGAEWEAYSAGTRPRTRVHPLAVAVMSELGIDISSQRPKPLDEFVGQSFDVVVSVCSVAEQDCARFSCAARREHWPLDDPAIAGEDPAQQMAIFRRLRDEAAQHIRAFLKHATIENT